MTFPLFFLVCSPPLSGRSNLPHSPVAAFFILFRQLLIPPPGELWVSFMCHSWRNDLEMCESIVENQRCGETSSSCAAFFSFSWPIIKTLLKYQCPERNEHTSLKWAKDIKEIWGCWRFYNWVKKGLMLMWFKVVLLLSNVSGLEYSAWVENDLLRLPRNIAIDVMWKSDFTHNPGMVPKAGICVWSEKVGISSCTQTLTSVCLGDLEKLIWYL